MKYKCNKCGNIPMAVMIKKEKDEIIDRLNAERNIDAQMSRALMIISSTLIEIKYEIRKLGRQK